MNDKANAGDDFRKTWTAEFYNKIQAFMAGGFADKITTAGPMTISKSGKGVQLVIASPNGQLSTLQGYLVGGDAPSVSDGTETIDPRAWLGYTIQAAYFKLTAGTCIVTVLINGVAVSWLNGIAVSSAGTTLSAPIPQVNTTHVVPTTGIVTIQISSSAGASGLVFSLNTPF